MIQPHEIFPTAMLQYNEDGTICEVKGIDADGLGITVYFPLTFEEEWLELSCFSGIPLTEKIFVEWKIAEFIHKTRGNRFYEISDGIMIMFDNLDNIFFYYGADNPLCKLPKYLHHLQMLVLALSNEPLKITLK